MDARELKEWLARNIPLTGVALSAVIGFFFVFLSLIVHETSHIAAARMLDCSAGIKRLDFVTGLSAVDCSGADWKLMMVALAGPLGATLYGMWVWFSGKDRIARAGAIASFFLSVIPSLYPGLEGGDMAKAIHHGLNPLLGRILFIAVFGVIFYQLIKECSEKERPFEV